MAKINRGEEITINYAGDLLVGKKREERQKYLLEHHHFICICNFCKLDDEDENDFTFYETFDQITKMAKLTKNAIKTRLHYPASNCRKQIDLCKKMYKIGKEKKISPVTMFRFLAYGIEAGVLGFRFAENLASKIKFKKDFDIFLRTANKFCKFLGNDAMEQILPKRIEEIMRIRYKHFLNDLTYRGVHK